MGDADPLDSGAAGPAALRGGVLRAASYGLGALVSLLAAALLFRHLGVEDGGRFVTAQSIAAVAAGLTDAGLTSIATREYAVRTGAARERVLRDLLGLRIVLTSAGVLGAVAFAALAGYDGILVIGTLIAGLGVLLNALQHQAGAGLAADLRQGWISTAEIARQVVAALVVIVLVALGASLLDLLWANAVGAAVALALIVAVVRRTLPLRPAFHVGRWRALVADTVAFSVATAVAAVYFRLAVIIVSLVATAEQTGFYGAAFRGVEVILVVPALLVGAVFPIFARAARDDRARLAYALGTLTDVMIPAGVGVAILLGVGAPTVIAVVAGDAFGPAADVLRIQGVGLLFSFVAAGFSFAALSLRLHREVLWACLTTLAVCVVLVPALAMPFGAVGAAVATTVSEAVLCVVTGLALRRGDVPFRLNVGRASRVLAAAGVGLLPALATPVPNAPRTVLCLLVFGAALLALRALPAEVRDLVPRRAR